METQLGADVHGRLVRAFVSTQYLLGRRGDELQLPFDASPEGERAARQLCEQLAQTEQTQRARTLAAEIAPLVRALGERALW